MNSTKILKIYEDLLDDVSALSTPGVDTSDSSPEWTDTDYYDLLIMIPYNLNTQHSYQDTISKCEDVEFILSTTKHIDDYSQVFAFCSKAEKTIPDPLEYPYVRPQFDAQTGCISFAIKHSFTNLRQVFKFLMNLNSLVYEGDRGIAKNSKTKRTGALMSIIGKSDNHWDFKSERESGGTHQLINPVVISKFINQLDEQYADGSNYRILDKMDEFKTIFYAAEMFIPQKEVFKGLEKYYKTQFDDFAFEQVLDSFLYRTPDADADDYVPASIRTFIKNHKGDKIDLTEIADKYINLDDNLASTAMLLNKKFPFERFSTEMKKWDDYRECARDGEMVTHKSIADTGRFASKYEILRFFAYLGINKEYDGIVVVWLQMSLSYDTIQEEAKSFVDDIDLMFGSVMKSNEKRLMIKEIINYSEQLQKKR